MLSAKYKSRWVESDFQCATEYSTTHILKQVNICHPIFGLGPLRVQLCVRHDGNVLEIGAQTVAMLVYSFVIWGLCRISLPVEKVNILILRTTLSYT